MDFLETRAELDALLPGYYTELRNLAQSCLAGERPDHTLQPTALVHEAYLRLATQHKVDWSCRAQVLALAARMMRRILANYAVARNAVKRNGGARIVLDTALEADLGLFANEQLDVGDVDRALTRLEELDERQARIVELRFFSGLSIEETAAAMDISPATVKREWFSARLFLAREIRGPQG